MPYALQADLSKGSICSYVLIILHSFILLWVDLPPLTLSPTQPHPPQPPQKKHSSTSYASRITETSYLIPLCDQQAEWLWFSFTSYSVLNCFFSAAGPMARRR